MSDFDDECIWVRMEWLLSRKGYAPLRVMTRKICCTGAFLECTSAGLDEPVQLLIPEPGHEEGGLRLNGIVTRAWRDGIWVNFRPALRSALELLMRHGLSLRLNHAHGPQGNQALRRTGSPH